MAQSNSVKKMNQASDDERTSFTIEIDNSHTMEVPSINRLLNRRSLHRNGTEGTLADTPVQTGTETIETSPPLAETAASFENQALTTKPAKRPRQIKKLTLWTLESLKQSPEPFAQGIASMIDRGANGALFLSLVYGSKGRTQADIECTSTAAAAPQTKINIWTGLKWMPSTVPQAWDQLIRHGSVEIPPPSADTLAVSYRSMLRTAFGLLPTEWLLLIRVGSERACRGIVAFTSQQTLYPELSRVQNLFLRPTEADAKVDLPK